MNIKPDQLRHYASEPRQYRVIEAALLSAADEIERLRELLKEARDHIGRMPTLDTNGNDTFLPTARLVHRVEDALGYPIAEDVRGIISPKH